MVNNTKDDNVRYWFDHDSIGYVEIDEPVGFRDDAMEYSRNRKYHGVFAIFSNNLEFYGASRDIIKTFFDTFGVNGRLKMGKDRKETITGNDVVWTNEYVGYLDFSTYSLSETKVTCRFTTDSIADILKARESTEVEIERDKTLDNKTITPIAVNQITLEPRDILKTDQSTLSTPSALYIGGQTFSPLTTVISNPHSDFSSVTLETVTGITANNLFYYMTDATSGANIDLNIKIDATATNNAVYPYPTYGTSSIVLKKVHWNGSSYDEINTYTMLEFNDNGITVNKINNQDLNLVYQDGLVMELIVTGGTTTLNKFNIIASEVSTFTASKTESNFVFVDALLKKLSEINLNRDILVSNYYTTGLGILRGFTNGSWIRNFVKGTSGYKSPRISFKDLISSLNAVDNIGLGIQKNGVKDELRVEDLKYFYQDVVLITIPNQVSNVTRDVYTDGYFNEMEFGYSKSGGYEQNMGLDESNVKSTFSSPINTIKKKYSAISKVRADGYGKEFSRRKPQDLFPTEDVKGDEDNWFLDVKDRLNENLPYKEKLWADRFDSEPTGIFSPETLTGAWFSPANNMLRHAWWFTQGFEKNLFDFTKFASSTGNSELTTVLNGESHKENQDFLNYDFDRPRLLPELIKFEAYVSNDLKNQLKGYTTINGESVPNVYGLVEFINEDGLKEYGYIQNVKPSGVGEWELLKYNADPRRSKQELTVSNVSVEMFSDNVLTAVGLDASINTAPTAPENLFNLNPVPSTPIEIELSWEASTDIDGNLAGYNVYYKKSVDTSWVLFNQTTFITIHVQPLDAYTSYDFYVSAYDSGTPSLESSPSNIVTATTAETTIPIMGVLSNGTITDTNIQLNWTEVTDNVEVDYYKLFYKLSSDSWSLLTDIIVYPINDLKYTASGLIANMSYDFRVQAIDTFGNISTDSNIITVLTLNTGVTLYKYKRSGSNVTSNNACSDTANTVCFSTDSELIVSSTIYNTQDLSDTFNGSDYWYKIDDKSYRINSSGVITEISLCLINPI